MGSTRRTVLVTGAAVLLTGCGGGGDQDEDGELARTEDIPVGGGKVFGERKVVVTQPGKGDFKAFSAICTHQNCTVSTVSDGTIDCACHGSRFSIEDGSVTAGPATRALPGKKITVTGNSIRLT
ncbi:iron-sulfur protein [Streptomyces poonensis]|uniref:Cytochrome bc1 complex Rieske iron-sulfur subunit n=2 Tax=Streptomyces poonensis TaxID=68255 RepID=A0A918UGM4_9ACTN|nr:iron-sulfur protein [Streptomyces poonensis]GLJ88691.1 iron-sulfur protein [Streptomyces poonensis]